MDQIKIGKFIAEKRKEENLTQNELAEKLYISDRAISKWERGICLPDVDNMIELCKLFDITISDLLNGEIVDMKDNEKVLEEELLEVIRMKEAKDKHLLQLEVVMGCITSITFLTLVLIAGLGEMAEWMRMTLILIGFIPFMIMVPFAIRIEQTAGYYECPKCKYRYIPTYPSVLWAQHFGRTRKMRCPNCHQKGWHKKVIRK